MSALTDRLSQVSPEIRATAIAEISRLPAIVQRLTHAFLPAGRVQILADNESGPVKTVYIIGYGENLEQQIEKCTLLVTETKPVELSKEEFQELKFSALAIRVEEIIGYREILAQNEPVDLV